MAGGKQTTTATPSSLDIEKAKTSEQLFGLLFPLLVPELSGGMSAGKAKDIANKNKQTVMGASAGKVAPGSPLMSQPIKGGPSSNMLNMALQLYGQAPQMPGSSSTSTTPGTLDYANSAANLGLIYKMLTQGSGSSIPSGGTVDSGGYMVNTPGIGE